MSIQLRNDESAALGLTDYLERPILRAWTPTVTQGVSVAATILDAYYILLGPIVHVFTRLSITGAGTAGSGIVVGGLPTPAQAVSSGTLNHLVGDFVLLNTGTAYYQGAVYMSTVSVFGMLIHNTGGGTVGNNPNFGLANGDIISLNCLYRRAGT